MGIHHSIVYVCMYVPCLWLISLTSESVPASAVNGINQYHTFSAENPYEVWNTAVHATTPEIVLTFEKNFLSVLEGL